MTTWYVAPDNTTTPGVTFGTIGVTLYAKSWNLAARWSDFQAAGGLWASKIASGDTVIFLAGKYNLSAITGGWSQLNNSALTGLTFSGQTIDGKLGFATFYGTRTTPWPAAGNGASGVVVGETFMRLIGANTAPTISGLGFVNLQDAFLPAAANGGVQLGTLTITDCYTRNTQGGICYTYSRGAGQLTVNATRLKCHGYSYGNLKIYGPITLSGCVMDSEFQSTAANATAAQGTSGAHVADAYPNYASTTWPLTVTDTISRNHAAGTVNSGQYPQGDGMIAEENAGVFTGRKILTYGNGDRGVDLKCSGSGHMVISWGDSTAGVAHHLDTQQYTGYSHLLKVGSRPAGVVNPDACAQTSGLLTLVQSALVCKPTTAQTTNNPYALSTGSVDPSKFQSSIYGAMHVGAMTLIDVWGVYGSTAGATEQNGYGGAPDSARVAAIFGLTPGATVNLAVRACAQDGSASSWTSPVQFVMDAAGSGDTTGPATPTGLAVSGTTSSTASFTWNQIASDAGTEIQGYLFDVSTDGGTTWLQVCPGKSASPVTFTGLAPATAYQFRIRAYDVNGNRSAASSSVTATTTSGSTNTSTPSVPLAQGVASQWISHPTMAGLSWNAPATGTVAYYEVKDNDSGLTLVRCYPAGQATPTYTKTNARLSTV